MRAFSCFIAFVTLMAASQAVAQSFTLKGVRFSDSVYLDQDQLQAVVKPYLDRPIRFQDVQRMVADVNRLYAAAGIPTAEAVLLPQDVPDGIVKIDLIEASIGQITVNGLEQTSPDFMRRSISLREGERPDYNQLERDLGIFGIAHDFVPTVTFGPGKTKGTVDATLVGPAPEGVRWTGSLDTFGTEDTGRERIGLSARWSNVTGVRDSLSAQVLLSEGSGVAALGYTRPVGGWQGGRVFATANYTEAQVIRSTFAPLDIVSNTTQISAGYRVPVRVRSDNHFMFEIGLVGEKTDSTLLGLPLQTTEVTEVVPQLSWQKTWPRQTLALSLGVKIGEADTAFVSETEGSYTVLFGAAEYARQLSDDYVLSLSGTMQYAPDENLPVPRLISAGGVTTVRGYPNNVRSGDSGVILRTQIDRRTAWEIGDRTKVYPFGFLDLAAIVPFRIDGSFDEEQDTLAAVGAGVRVEIGSDISGLVLVGVPLRDTLGFEDKGKASLLMGVDYRF
jgi:hemolysin activation/secretion protein